VKNELGYALSKGITKEGVMKGIPRRITQILRNNSQEVLAST
jgi:hypothetical protein